MLDHVRGGVQVDQALVDPEFEPVPGVGTFTAGGLAHGELQGLGGHAHGALDLEALLLGAADQISAHLLQVRHVLRCERDPNAVHTLFDSIFFAGAGRLVGSRLWGWGGRWGGQRTDFCVTWMDGATSVNLSLDEGLAVCCHSVRANQ